MPMTPEERERYDRIDHQLEFLAANAARHDAEIAEHSKQIRELADGAISLTRVVEEQGHRMEQSQSRTDEQLRELAESQRRLAESQRHTDERLSALINVVERYFSNGRH